MKVPWPDPLALDRPVLVPTVRIVLCGFLATLRMDGEGLAFTQALRRPAALMHAPVLEALGVPSPPSPFIAELVPTALVVLAALAALGVLTRLSLAMLFCLWVYTGEHGSGFGFFNHTPALPAQIVLLLAIVPGVTAWSVDRAIIAAIRRDRSLDVLAPLAPRFGELVVLLGTGLVYCASGIAKLRYGAVSWLDGSTLAYYLRGQNEPLWYGPLEVDPARAWKDGFAIEGYVYASSGRAQFLTAVPGLPALLALGSLALELGAPVMLLAGARSRGIFCVAGITFHLAVVAIIGPPFVPWIVILTALYPWPETVAWVRARRAGRSRA